MAKLIEAGNKKKTVKDSLLTQLQNECWSRSSDIRADFDATQGGRKRKNTFTEKILATTPAEHDLDELKELYDVAYDANSQAYGLFKKSADAFGRYDLSGADLMGRSIISSSDTTFAAFMRTLGATDWVKNGHAHYVKNSDGKCPFCQQKLPENFENDIASCFDEQYQNDQSALAEFQSAYKGWTQSILDVFEENLTNVFPKLDIELYKEKVTHLQTVITANLRQIEKKIDKPALEVELDDVKPLIMEIDTMIDGFNKQIAANNTVVNSKKTKKKECEDALWEYRICVVYLMTKDKSIFIKNIYYMLSYAFQILKQSNYDEVASEKFENAQDLFAAILSKGIAQQLKQGLYREYITKNETLSIMRGKLNLQETLRNRIQRKQKLACEFDELSENNLFNQILKTAIHYLLINDGVDMERKSALKKILVFFDGIELLEPSWIPWSRLHYQQNNKNYEMLINVCYFVLDGMLQTTEKGKYKMAAFSDEHMARLYEKFILEYYSQHHTYLSEVKAGQVKWDLVGDNSEYMIRFLPIMQTDIMLRLKDQILIIDAKYYGKTLQQQYDKNTLHSNNVYQIFTYVKNQDKDNTGNVAGILLYAKTDEDITPDCMFNLGGNQIGAKTLDLNKEFPLIAAQLDKLAESFFVREMTVNE